MFLAPLIRINLWEWEFLNTGSNSPLLFQPVSYWLVLNVEIFVLNVENYEDRAGKNLMTAPWRIKALSSACWSWLRCHCCFFCHRRKLRAGVNPVRLPLSSSGAANRHQRAQDPLVFVWQSTQGWALQLWEVQLSQLPACSHTHKMSKSWIFFSKTLENHSSLDSLDQSPALGRSKVISYLISWRKPDTLGFHSSRL